MCDLHEKIFRFPETDDKVVKKKTKFNENGYIRAFLEECKIVDRKSYAEARQRLHSDFSDSLSYSFRVLIEAFKNVGYSAAELARKLNKSGYVFDEFDTIPSTGYLLKEKLKLTRGKARRKLCRQIRKWEMGKFLLSKKEIEECQKMINLK